MTIIEKLANLLSCKTDTVVTIIATVTIFIVGLLINLIAYRIKRSVERRNYREYYYSLIANIREYSIRQAKGLKESIDNLKIDNQPLFIIKRRTENSFNTFDKVSFDKLYNSFFSGWIFKRMIRRKAFNFILNYNALIKFYYDSFPKDIERLDTTFRRFEDSFNANIDNIRNIYELLRQKYFSNKLDQNYITLFLEFDSILQIWIANPDKTNRNILKTYILDKLDSQFFSKYKSLEIATRLEISTSDALLAYLNMEQTLDNFSRHFSNYYWLLKQYERKIRMAQTILVKTNFIK